MAKLIRTVSYFDGIENVQRKLVESASHSGMYYVYDEYADGVQDRVTYKGKILMNLAQADYLLDVQEQ